MLTANEIAKLIQSDRPDERVRANMQPRDSILGYAIEVVRLINGVQYQYVGWVSLNKVRGRDVSWITHQKAMCDKAFEAAILDKSDA